MAESQNIISGFSDHVQAQLHQAAREVPIRQQGRGRGYRGRGLQHHPNAHQQHHQGHRGNFGPQRQQQPVPQPFIQQAVANPTDMSSFPPLGSSRPQPSRTSQHSQRPNPPMRLPLQNPQIIAQPQLQYHSQVPNDQPSVRFQPPQHSNFDQQGRGHRGAYRGRNQHNFGNPQHQNHNQFYQKSQSPDGFQRPNPIHRQLFTPPVHPHFQSMDEQREIQRRIMEQSDFLNHLAFKALKYRITVEEQQQKENFRRELEIIARKAILEHHGARMKFSASEIELKVYGSLGSGFGVTSSDMDLLLTFPQNRDGLEDVEIESRRQLEKALLDAGIGARLLTKTRVPILRVCQLPGPDLLKNLRDCRLMWEQELENDESQSKADNFGVLPLLTETQSATTQEAFRELTLDAHEVPLPSSPTMERSKLEYDVDCGILCDINFANYLALKNTLLLKTYGMCDPRVVEVGVFVKTWAKARDIKTPYRGTLSSYGYLMLVLHYLMNVVNPPLIPNLQDLAKQKDVLEGKTEVELFEGYDVRFVQNMDEVRSVLQVMPRNHESVGSLLRGFFHYYADTRGFHWNQDVISIRTPGGRLTKRDKGWTEAKWAGNNQHVRLRYLLAIEDPFELEHNVGRTVGHSGIVAIRDEFRRAWSVIEHIKQDNDRSWFWLSQDGEKNLGTELMSVIENRGDLLRKDQEFHRNKTRQMRQALEVKEKALRDAATEANESQDEMESNGTSELKCKCLLQDCLQCDFPISTASTYDNNSQISIRRLKPLNQKTLLRNHENMVNDDIRLTCYKQGNKSSKMQKLTNAALSCKSWNAFAAHQAMRTNIHRLKSGVSKLQSQDISTICIQCETKNRCAESNTDVLDSDVKSRLKCSRCIPMCENAKPELYTGRQLASFRKPRGRMSGNPRTYVHLYPETHDRTDTGMTLPAEAAADTGNDYSINCDKHSPMYSRSVDTLETSSRKTPGYLGQRSTIVTANEEPASQNSQWTNHKYQVESVLQVSPSEDVKISSRSPSLSHVPCVDPKKPESQIASQSHGHTVINKIATPVPNGTIFSAEKQPSSSFPVAISIPTPTTLPMHVQIVPQTLFPNTPNHLRPRHEDPRIMPIPSSLNFRFDLRQLADLEIIRCGGNACAKAGEEFDIEVDYEFGGAGIMASRSKVGLVESLRDIGDFGCEVGDRFRDSDSEVLVLLDELPGYWDEDQYAGTASEVLELLAELPGFRDD